MILLYICLYLTLLYLLFGLDINDWSEAREQMKSINSNGEHNHRSCTITKHRDISLT